MSPHESQNDTFPGKDTVRRQTVTFKNRYGVTLSADLYVPKQSSGRLAALAVSGPGGQVRAQAFGRYAHALAEQGFITLAFDPSCPEKLPHDMNSFMTAENVSAAVAYLSTRSDVDATRIGICGFGGSASCSEDMENRTEKKTALHDLIRFSDGDRSDSTERCRCGRYAANESESRPVFAEKQTASLSADEEKLARDFYEYFRSRALKSPGPSS